MVTLCLKLLVTNGDLMKAGKSKGNSFIMFMHRIRGKKALKELQKKIYTEEQVSLQEKRALMTNGNSSLLKKKSSLNHFNDENRRRHLSSQ
nr:hypothetical protein [Tanacetum cinerariifolium]